MADIPVERTGTGTPWWLWLLGALLLLGLIWFLISAFGDDEDDIAVVDDTTVVEDPVVAPAPMATLDLSNLYVTRVVGDRAFFVAPSEAESGNETLVLLDQNMSPDAPGIEGQVDVNPGQRISIDGDLEPLGDMNLAGMGLSDSDANAMLPDTQVIRADGGDIEILDAPMGVGDVEADQ